ncbi:MAG: serine/threonine protein kinase, partial [Deltaproteobacteria bacterium]|nr:serine/threonine protein kinase [Kofleriaceae bacterium]
MPGYDDETETSSQITSDPALDATVEAAGTPPPPVGDADAERDGGVPRVAFIGRYKVVDVLGSGGMGVVYRARDPDLDRELAIKVVRSHSGTPRAQERLLEEARAMAKLRHPAVVPVFDIGTTARGVFIVMPMVGGGTFYDWMKAPHPWRQVVERFLAAGRGLAAAHAAGLIHRDFKPRNVLVGERGEVMVADFGIAARTDDSIDPERASSTPGSAQVSSIAGTPAYMAPEQATSATIDARADQYSFCISIWEALCGERPHEAETRTQGGVALPAVATSAGRAKAPSWLLAAIARGFSASPDHRWPSMNALLEHIERRLRRPRQIAVAVGAAGLLATAAAAALLASDHAEDPCPDPRPDRAVVPGERPALRRQDPRQHVAGVGQG